MITTEGGLYLTVKEAAERWGLTYGGLLAMIHRNEIPYIQIGKQTYRLREEDFVQSSIARKPKGPVEKLADRIADFPAEDVFMLEEYADFLESRRAKQRKGKRNGEPDPGEVKLADGWKRL